MQRTFILGSEWLYCKIYTGEKNADSLIAYEIFELNRILYSHKLIDKSFFIRYSDSAWHIRLRYHVTQKNNIYTIVNFLYEKFNHYIENRKIHLLMYDTYKRELERYGEKTYDLTESIFNIDSQSIIELISIMYALGNKENIRWKIALLLLDDLFDIFFKEYNLKLLFVKKMRDAYRREFGIVTTAQIRQFNNKYRKYKYEIEDTMHRNIPKTIISILDNRKKEIEYIYNIIRNKLEVNENDYLSSIAHMSINRLFISNNRFCELVVYDYLYRYYDSYLAQLKYRANSHL